MRDDTLFFITEDEDALYKGADHKYLRRIMTGKAKPKYHYIYSATSVKHGGKPKVGEKVRIDHEGKKGHYEITHDHDDGHISVKHDETGHTMKVEKGKLQSLFHGQHGTSIDKQLQEHKRINAQAGKTGTAKQQAIAQANLDKFRDVYNLPKGEPKAEPKAGSDPQATFAEWQKNNPEDGYSALDVVRNEADYAPGDALSGKHDSKENAYIIDDYPYGSKRTQMKVWKETKEGKGQRVMRMTKNPKTGSWNKPKASIYSPAMGLSMDESGHVKSDALNPNNATSSQEFYAKHGDALVDPKVKTLAAGFSTYHEAIEGGMAEPEARKLATESIAAARDKAGVVMPKQKPTPKKRVKGAIKSRAGLENAIAGKIYSDYKMGKGRDRAVMPDQLSTLSDARKEELSIPNPKWSGGSEVIKISSLTDAELHAEAKARDIEHEHGGSAEPKAPEPIPYKKGSLEQPLLDKDGKDLGTLRVNSMDQSIKGQPSQYGATLNMPDGSQFKVRVYGDGKFKLSPSNGTGAYSSAEMDVNTRLPASGMASQIKAVVADADAENKADEDKVYGGRDKEVVAQIDANKKERKAKAKAEAMPTMKAAARAAVHRGMNPDISKRTEQSREWNRAVMKFGGQFTDHITTPEADAMMEEALANLKAEDLKDPQTVGHTKSGKKIHAHPGVTKTATAKKYEGWSPADHKDAAAHFEANGGPSAYSLAKMHKDAMYGAVDTKRVKSSYSDNMEAKARQGDHKGALAMAQAANMKASVKKHELSVYQQEQGYIPPSKDDQEKAKKEAEADKATQARRRAERVEREASIWK